MVRGQRHPGSAPRRRRGRPWRRSAWTRPRCGRHGSSRSASSASSIAAPRQRPADVLGDVVVAEADRVGVAERPLPHLGAGPDTDPGQRAQPARRPRRRASSRSRASATRAACTMVRERAGSMCIRSHSHDGIAGAACRPSAAARARAPARARRPLAVAVDQRAEAGERLLAGHLLLDDRRHQRLHHPAGAAQPPVRVSAGARRPAPGGAARSRSGRRGRRADAGTDSSAQSAPGPHASASTSPTPGQRLDHQGGRADRGAQGAPVPRSGPSPSIR